MSDNTCYRRHCQRTVTTVDGRSRRRHHCPHPCENLYHSYTSKMSGLFLAGNFHMEKFIFPGTELSEQQLSTLTDLLC